MPSPTTTFIFAALSDQLRIGFTALAKKRPPEPPVSNSFGDLREHVL